MNMPTTKSQERAMRLAALPVAEGYSAAARALEAAGMYADGIPASHTWRSAAKLSDTELAKVLVRVPVEPRRTAWELAEIGD